MIERTSWTASSNSRSGLSLADQPVQHVAIEQAPIAPRQHMGAVARPDADQPFSRQHFDRLTNHAAADAEADFEVVFGWQYRAGRDDLLSDLAAECRQHRVNAARLRTLFGGFGALGTQESVRSRPPALRPAGTFKPYTDPVAGAIIRC